MTPKEMLAKGAAEITTASELAVGDKLLVAYPIPDKPHFSVNADIIKDGGYETFLATVIKSTNSEVVHIFWRYGAVSISPTIPSDFNSVVRVIDIIVPSIDNSIPF